MKADIEICFFILCFSRKKTIYRNFSKIYFYKIYIFYIYIFKGGGFLQIVYSRANYKETSCYKEYFMHDATTETRRNLVSKEKPR